jgi:hypothetical protein
MSRSPVRRRERGTAPDRKKTGCSPSVQHETTTAGSPAWAWAWRMFGQNVFVS